MSEEIVIHTIDEYVEHVCKLNGDENKRFPFHLDELLFRGQSNRSYALLPSIARGRRYICDCSIFNEERNLIEMAKFKMPDIFRGDLSPLELLALLQHHGIPTRLLDVTENALVALYFACCSKSDADGEVVVFKHDNEDVTNYPIANAIADSYRFVRSTWRALSLFYGDIKSQPYCLEQKQTYAICHENDAVGGQWVKECCEKIFYIYAPIRSMRQQMQHGRYILFPNRITSEEGKEAVFESIIDPISKDHEDVVARLIIPKESKRQFLSDLTVLGVSKEFLFCDNVDTVCGEIVGLFQKKYKKP